MELEQRVKTLEYEIKVLKSEIQRTLLDIQEQILVHYYPALRSEQEQVPEAARQAVQTARAASEQSRPALLPPAPAPAPIVPELVEQVQLAPVPAPVAPVIRKVTLDEVRSTQPPSVNGGDSISRMSKLLEWTLDSGSLIGNDRVKALIQTCGTREILSPEMIEVLLRIAPLNRRTPPELVGVREVIQVVTQLDSIMGRPADIEAALALIEEAKIG